MICNNRECKKEVHGKGKKYCSYECKEREMNLRKKDRGRVHAPALQDSSDLMRQLYPDFYSMILPKKTKTGFVPCLRCREPIAKNAGSRICGPCKVINSRMSVKLEGACVG